MLLNISDGERMVARVGQNCAAERAPDEPWLFIAGRRAD